MMIALVQLRIGDAFSQNPCIMILLPIAFVMAFDAGVSYVLSGNAYKHGWINRAACIMVVILIAFGIFRNLPI